MRKAATFLKATVLSPWTWMLRTSRQSSSSNPACRLHRDRRVYRACLFGQSIVGTATVSGPQRQGLGDLRHSALPDNRVCQSSHRVLLGCYLYAISPYPQTAARHLQAQTSLLSGSGYLSQNLGCLASSGNLHQSPVVMTCFSPESSGFVEAFLCSQLFESVQRGGLLNCEVPNMTLQTVAFEGSRGRWGALRIT